MDDHKVSHLEMIQGVINRMAGNSFALKGWAVTLVAGIFALSSKDADRTYFIVAYIPIIVFWFWTLITCFKRGCFVRFMKTQGSQTAL